MTTQSDRFPKRNDEIHTFRNWTLGLIAVGLWVLGVIKLIEIVFL